MFSMKNVDVAWRLIYVVRVWRKLKKMTSMLLLSNPGFESAGLSIVGFGLLQQLGLKQNRRTRLPHCLLRATPQTPETVGNPKKWNLRGATAV